jgi:glycosyltransferase involved in cell wall biosynthesis
LDSASLPTFSVITAAFNEEDVISSALESVKRQSREDWEMWVVDDGSTDATSRVVEPYLSDQRINLLSQSNAGLPAARNAGIERARGRYLTILDADDLLMPAYLERMGATLDADERAGFAYTDPWSFDTDRRRFKRKKAMARNRPPVPPPSDPIETMRELLERNYLFVGATIRRGAIDEAGAFDPSMAYCEDLELWLRILRTGRTAITPGDGLAIKRVGSGAMSRNSPEIIKYLRVIAERLAGDEGLPDSLRADARQRIVELDRFRDALGGPDRRRSAGLGARLALGSAYRAVLAPYVWRRRPPSDVRSALPDLVQDLGIRKPTRPDTGGAGL